ncbi:hypothetical protein [Dysgonomonas sp. ZJ709]|uniref:hypothetical protein n=1 Tax=Dysgonomonas sp. ZJ709 TaxID=2709797 RepID=UPI0013ECD150|nr:hypothetical protein [Dysgonomonas sp. ZJ709]
MDIVEIKTGILKQSGFTESGIKRYTDTVTDYSSLLLEKSKKFGEARKAIDSEVEINYENVQDASKVIMSHLEIDKTPKWKLWAQAGEYLLTAGCGYLGSQATQENSPAYFTLLFVIAAVIGVGIFIVRKTSKN